jgi:hypothetical protein
MLQDESLWFREALFNGMTSNAFKLGTMLTQGWFWIRRGGATAIYRGDGISQVDLSRLVHVADSETKEVPLPTHLSHPADSTHCYLVRRFDSDGRQEKTTAGAVTVRIGPNGGLAPSVPNGLFDLKGKQISGRRLRLTWFYDPLDQETAPQEFSVYSDGVISQVDMGYPIAMILYHGRRLYQYETASLDVGLHRFVVRPHGADSRESFFSAMVVCAVTVFVPEAPTILYSGVT